MQVEPATYIARCGRCIMSRGCMSRPEGTAWIHRHWEQAHRDKMFDDTPGSVKEIVRTPEQQAKVMELVRDINSDGLVPIE